MSTPADSLAIRVKVDDAVKAYLAARVAAYGTSALTGVPIRTRLDVNDGKKVMPIVVVETGDAPAFEDLNTLYMCQTVVGHAGLATDPTPAEAAAKHAERTGLLTEWLADRESFKAYINQGRQPWITPAPDPITLPVPQLHVSDILLNAEDGEQAPDPSGGHWLEALTYLIPAQIAD
jgi:hypothetical protein